MTKAILHRTFASLKIRNFRLYFIGLAISQSGSWMQIVAFGWLALQLTGSGAQLGGVIAMQFLPILLLGSWVGVLVDRLDKRHVVLYSQWAGALVSLAMGGIILAGLANLWVLYAFGIIFGFVRVFDNVGRQTFIYEMVDHERLKNAISLNSVCNNLARIIGPSIGGLVILGMGTAGCFFLNGFAYFGVIAMLLSMRENELHHREKAQKKTGQLMEGFRYVWATPLIRDTLIMVAIIGTFTFEWQVSLPLIAQRTFLGNAASYAALMSAFGAGAVIGGLFAAGRHKIAPHTLIIFSFLFGASIVITSFLPTLTLAIVGMVVVGFFGINVMSTANTIIQLEAAPEMRGRVMSMWTIAMQGSTPIGGPIVGIVGEYLGSRWGLGIGGIAALLACAVAAFPLLKKDKTYPVSEEVQTGSEAVVFNADQVEAETMAEEIK